MNIEAIKEHKNKIDEALKVLWNLNLKQIIEPEDLTNLKGLFLTLETLKAMTLLL